MPDVIYRVAEASDLARLLEVWTEVFQVPESIFIPMLEATTHREQRFFVAELEGQIASVVGVFLLDFTNPKGEWERVGCIANVATVESGRKQGLSGQLLQHAIAWMEETECAWSYLFTGVPPHYARFGWKEMFAPTLVARPFPDLRGDDKSLSVEDVDLDVMAGVHEEWSHQHSLVVKRNGVAWNRKVLPRLADRRVLIEPNGYAILSLSPERMNVDEIAARDSKCLNRLVEQVMIACQRRGLPEARFAVPADLVRDAVHGLAASVSEENECVGMARPVRLTMDQVAARLETGKARFSRIDTF